jgi:protein subunit release factor B
MLTVVFLGIGFVMKVESLEQQIAKQEERLKQLKAQKQAVLAREKKKATDQQRKEDTRRKILLGSLALKKMQDDSVGTESYEDFAKRIADMLLEPEKFRTFYPLLVQAGFNY